MVARGKTPIQTPLCRLWVASSTNQWRGDIVPAVGELGRGEK
jgi:hypothetical protein